MEHQRIIFESSPSFIIVCLLLGVGYGFLLYKRNYPWTKSLNTTLFALRSVLAFFIAFLLLGPIVRHVSNSQEKPMFVLLQDNSASVKEAVDSATLKSADGFVSVLEQRLTEKGYDVVVNDLEGNEGSPVNYNASSSDLQGGLKKISNQHEGRKLAGVVMISDGIYNGGLSPLYSSYNFPVYTLGVGDTTQRADIMIKNIAYNRIAYQGNKFPIRVEVVIKGLKDANLHTILLHKGKVLDSKSSSGSNESLVVFEFQPLADEQGIQRYDIQVDVLPQEYNKRNNRASIFVEIVEGKKKILLVAGAPHPDIKALRMVVENNSNYEFLLHIPGIKELQPEELRPENNDLAIFHQSPDQRGRTSALFQQYINSTTSMLISVGKQTDFSFLNKQSVPLKMDVNMREFDEVTPVINPAFKGFEIEDETRAAFSNYPPVNVPFGRIQASWDFTEVLSQRIGSVVTDRPLLSVSTLDNRKIAILFGEGIWRWRLDEFDRNEDTNGFDELFGKLIQYLSTNDEKKRFRSYPVEQEFSEIEPVIFESQVYNDIFEPVFGNEINIELTDEQRKNTRYTYVTSPGNIRYQIGGLKEGVYHYRSSTDINGKKEEVRGQFAVVARMAELQNLTADFNLLRKLSVNTGGEFYTISNASSLVNKLSLAEAKGVLHTEETYNSIINIKWIFWILLAMISCEWFLRKYFGDY